MELYKEMTARYAAFLMLLAIFTLYLFYEEFYFPSLFLVPAIIQSTMLRMGFPPEHAMICVRMMALLSLYAFIVYRLVLKILPYVQLFDEEL